MNAERLRPAAILALRHSLVIFVLAMVIIPFRSLMNRIFDHTWYVNWLAVVEVSGILTMIFICFHFFAQLLEMGMADRRARGNRLVFSAAMWLRGTYLFCIIMGVGLPVGMYREGVRGGVLYIPILFLLLGYFSWPRAVRLGDGDIRTHDAFFRVTSIPYAEISRVAVDHSRGEVVVFGKHGESIVRSNLHVGEVGIVGRLREVTGKQITILG